MDLLGFLVAAGAASLVAWVVRQDRLAAEEHARKIELMAMVDSLERQRLVPADGSCCPACPNEPKLTPAAGELGEKACAVCQGRLLEPDATDAVLIQHRQWSPKLLKQARWSAHERLVPCYACKRFMGPIKLAGCMVHLCRGCGRSFFPKGALTAIGEGRWLETTV